MTIFSNDFKHMLKEILISGKTTTSTFWLALIIGIIMGFSLRK